ITPYSIDCRQSAIHDEDAISWQYTCEFDFGDYKISVSTHSLEHADEVVWMNFNNEYPVQIENQSIEDVGFYTRQFLSKK
ncbi:hypothetical protein ACI4B7_28585, partial [Klebsiella pneumoniae]|uniref:hypothetical protein n=1 Tax=Klebsiella pneumoniae TaxID=573 RepID=UPI003852B13B